MNNRIELETKEFKLFEANATISLKEAQDIHFEYIKERDKNEDKRKHSFSKFLFCEDGCYVFGLQSEATNDKMGRYWIFFDLAIDAQTGDTLRMEGFYKVIDK